MRCTLGRKSLLNLAALSLPLCAALGGWPPRDARALRGLEACEERLFWAGVEAQAALASLQGRDSDSLPRELAAVAQGLEAALQTHPHSAEINRFLTAVASGMPPQLAFQTLAVSGDPREPGVHTGVSISGQAVFKGQSYANVIEPWFDSELDTAFFRPRETWFPAGSELFAPIVSGVGADYSHSGSNFSLLNLLMSAKTSGILADIKLDPHFTRVAAFSFDLPNTGTAFRSASFGKDLETNLLWLRSALTRPAAFWPKEKGRPLFVPISRSASPSILMEMHQRFPSLLSGMIHTSPLHPNDLAVANRVLEKMIHDKVFTPNYLALRWIDDLYAQMQWHQQEDPFKGDIPVLILVGSEDKEETHAFGEKVGWGIYREWERRFPNKVRFIIVQGAGHDLFATRDKAVLLRVMRYIHRFFHFVVNGEKDLAAAFPVEKGELRNPIPPETIKSNRVQSFFNFRR